MVSSGISAELLRGGQQVQLNRKLKIALAGSAAGIEAVGGASM